MKKQIVWWMMVWMTIAVCHGQGVALKVTPVQHDKRTTGTSGSYYLDRTQTRSQTIKIDLTNMYTNTFEYGVEWFFLAKPVSGGASVVYDCGKQTMSLKRSAFDSLELQSAEIQSHTSDYGYGTRYATGEKTDGYVVVVWAGDKIVGVEASDITNRRTYSTPNHVKKLETQCAERKSPTTPAVQPAKPGRLAQ